MKNLKNGLNRQIVGRAVLLLCLATSAAFADAVKLNIYGLPNGSNSPYQAHITPQPSGPTINVLVACLDLRRSVSANVDYNYDRTLNSGPNWGAPNNGVPNFSDQTMYDAAALLMAQLIATPFASPAADDLSYAIWEIFDNSAAPLNSNAETLAHNALTAAGLSTTVIPTYYVYTPLDPLVTGKQRFLSVPDGGFTLMLLGGVLVGIESLRRKLRT